MTTPFVGDPAAALATVRTGESRRPPGERLFEDPYATLFVADAGPAEADEQLLRVPFFREEVRLRTRAAST